MWEHAPTSTVPYVDLERNTAPLGPTALGIWEALAIVAELAFSEDHAMATYTSPTGGIDLNANVLDLDISNNKQTFKFPLPTIEMIQRAQQAASYSPVILNVAPIENLPFVVNP